MKFATEAVNSQIAKCDWQIEFTETERADRPCLGFLTANQLGP